MKSLEDYKRSVIWHVVTGKYEVLPDLTLRRRTKGEFSKGGAPRNWGHYRFKDRCNYVMGQNLPKEMTNTLGLGTQFLRTNDVFEESNIEKQPLHFDGDLTGLVVKNKNDLLICTEGFNTEVGKGTLGLCTKKFEGIISDHLRIVKIKGTLEEVAWIEYCHQSPEVAFQLVAQARGSIAYRASHVLPELKFLMPRDQELSLAVAFLEKFTSSLPDPAPLIAAKEAFKKSLIWHVVTGKYEVLDNGKLRRRNAGEMKSKNGWKIPKEWDVVRLKDVATLIAGGTPSSSNRDFYTENGDGFDWVQVCDIKGGLIESTSKQVTEEGKEFTKTLPSNSVVLAMYASVGKCGMTNMAVEINQAVLGITPNNPHVRDWIFYGLSMQEEKTAALGRGGTQNNTNASICRNISLPWPLRDEREKIIGFLCKPSNQYE